MNDRQKEEGEEGKKARASGLAFGIQFSRYSAFARECLRRLIVNAGLPLVFQLQGSKRTAWPIVALRSIIRDPSPAFPFSENRTVLSRRQVHSLALSLSPSLSPGLAFYLICRARGLITRRARSASFALRKFAVEKNSFASSTLREQTTSKPAAFIRKSYPSKVADH